MLELIYALAGMLTGFRISLSTSRKRSAVSTILQVWPHSRLPQFDSRKGATWHCVVGRNFGSFVTHGECPRGGRRTVSGMLANQLLHGTETKHFIYFYLGHCAILLFKTQ